MNNVYHLRPPARNMPSVGRPRPNPLVDPGNPYKALTAALVLEKHRKGELEPALLEYLLEAALPVHQ